jgi:hypothetical protein
MTQMFNVLHMCLFYFVTASVVMVFAPIVLASIAIREVKRRIMRARLVASEAFPATYDKNARSR